MSAYLVYHNNGDIYERDNDTLMDDLYDMIDHGIDTFNATDNVKPLLSMKVEQYRNSEYLEDHRPPSQTIRGALGILSWVVSGKCTAANRINSKAFNRYKQLHRDVESSWEGWMTSSAIQ